MVMPVSDLLADAMKKALSNNLRDITVIPNVVNDLFYSLSKNEYSKKTPRMWNGSGNGCRSDRLRR